MDFSGLLKPGLKGETRRRVDNTNTAAAWGSGGLEVFSTPVLVAIMEGAAMNAVAPLLPKGWSTVGTEVNIRHLSATPVGMEVRACAELISVDRRALFFRVEAFDESGKVGEGTHGRFIVENEKFREKAEAKKAP